MLRLGQLQGFWVGGTPISGFFESTGSGGSSPATIAGLSFGPAAGNRYLVAAVYADSSSAVSAVTIGGISATLVVKIGPSSTANVGLWIAAVPTGTSGSVVVTYGTGACAVNLYALYGINPTAIDTSSSTTSPFSHAFVPSKQAFIIGAIGLFSGSNSFTSGITRDGSTGSINSGSVLTAGAGSVTVGMSGSPSSGGIAFAAAIWTA